MSKYIDTGRRDFLHGAAMAVATAPLALGRTVHAQGARR